MFGSIFKKFSGRHYRKFYKKCTPIVAQINKLEEEYQSLSDEALRSKTGEFRQRFQDGESLDSLLPEAFAVVKNAARRLCGQTINVCDHELQWEMVHYDVQLVGGIALHEGSIAEMATGEGKTLVSTLPLYLNALSGHNCQLVTVNDYLARRDSEWMGYLFKFLGLTVGCIQNGLRPEERKVAYGADITYGTASEFGFDYLRDNGMASRKDDQVQREHFYCIVDEIDSILIDEARTPLIISGPAQEQRELPFNDLKPGVQALVNKQNTLCNQLVNEGKKLLEAAGDDRQRQQDALYKLLQVRLGMPKNRQMAKLLESGPARKLLENYHTEMHSDFNKKHLYALKEELYYTIDEKQHQADLTEKGRTELSPGDPDAFIMPDLPTEFMEIDRDVALDPKAKQEAKRKAEEHFAHISERIHTLSQLLRAYSLYERDKEYVVQEGKVHIIDENTGRMMPGRRWSDGLHAAVESKEGVKIEKETKTYATITIQNYFRLYEKLAGMTGTAETEAGEFHDIYKLTVTVIPTHRPCQRKDANDVVYKTRREKYNAAIEEIQQAHQKGQPCLVGTASVGASETLSKMLKRAKVPHSVLNAKYHQQEAEIVSRAGQKGAVTIATNMAGRGTDIKLGEGVPDLGGLHVIGTERHESRRIDRQLRGRCARQGDPGSSKFFVSLEDDLMRLFANAGPISRILEKSFQEGDILEHPLLNRSIETAQKKVEQQNYSIRKRLLQFDDVLNKQREVIYGLRNDAIHSDEPREVIFEMVEEELRDRVELAFPGKGEPDPEDLQGFLTWLNGHFPVSMPKEELEGCDVNEAVNRCLNNIREAYATKESFEEKEALLPLERYVIIRAIDKNWQDHLTEMDELRRSVNLRSYGQKDPLVEYKSEGFRLFEEMLGRVRNDVCSGLFRSATNVQAFQNMLATLSQKAKTSGPANAPQAGGVMAGAQAAQRQLGPQPAGQQAQTSGGGTSTAELPKVEPVRRQLPKIGRNDTVTIRKGSEEQTMKFKKAEPLLQNEGWQLVRK